MLAFRLLKEKYAHELSGKGASLSNNRWNSKGTEVIYLAQSRALALAEVLVHLPLHGMPDPYCLLEIELPGVINVQRIQPHELHPKWNEYPHHPSTQIIGDRFTESMESLVLGVPSAVVPGDYNFLVNPKHVDFHRVSIKSRHPFPFDRRFFAPEAY